jgi:hypothetical protein
MERNGDCPVSRPVAATREYTAYRKTSSKSSNYPIEC